MKIDDLAPEVLIIRDLKEILRYFLDYFLTNLRRTAVFQVKIIGAAGYVDQAKICPLLCDDVCCDIKDITFWSPVFGAGRVLYPV